MQKTSTIITSLVIAVLAGGIAGGGTSYVLLQNMPSAPASSTAPVVAATPGIPNAGVSAEVKKLKPSVVSIVETQELQYMVGGNPFSMFGNGGGSQFFGFPFGNGMQMTPEQNGNNDNSQPQMKTEQQETGAGTGFIISSDGMVLTNKHVVADTKAEYTAIMSDGTKYPAKVLARDPSQDLALVQIQGTSGTTFTPVTFIDSMASTQVGDFVLAIGNALGQFDNSVSFGVISATDRTITAQDERGGAEDLHGSSQTDAAINPGNSGGPLIDLSGTVVGITTAVAGDAQGIGFALPLDASKVEAMQAQLKQYGKLVQPYIGIRYETITPELNKEQNLGVDQGAWIHAEGDLPAVLKDSPAAKAGLKGGDIITKVDGVAVDQDNQLIDLLTAKKIGDTVTLTYIRDGKEQTAQITLAELPDQDATSMGDTSGNDNTNGQ